MLVRYMLVPIYVSADGDLPYRPCFIGGFQNIVQLFQAQFRLSDVFHSFASLKPATNFNFQKSSEGMKKEVKKEYSKKVRDRTISDKLQLREYSDMSLYNARKAWMTGRIWSHEIKSIDKQLEKEKRKILLICDNYPSHQVVPLQNVEFYR